MFVKDEVEMFWRTDEMGDGRTREVEKSSAVFPLRHAGCDSPVLYKGDRRSQVTSHWHAPHPSLVRDDTIGMDSYCRCIINAIYVWRL